MSYLFLQMNTSNIIIKNINTQLLSPFNKKHLNIIVLLEMNTLMHEVK